MDVKSTPDNIGQRRTDKEWLQFEHIAEYSRDLIGACGLDGVPIYLNPSVLRLVGLDSMQAARAIRFTDFFFAEDVDFVQKTLLPQVIQEDYAETEIRLRHFKTQEPIWINYAVFPVKNDHGEIVSVATISRTIGAHQKNTQPLEGQEAGRIRSLEKDNEKLERINQELSSFAYTSSHDLQTPLRKIQAFTAWLLENESANLSVQGQEYFRRMRNAVQQMQTLMDDLLTYARTTTDAKLLQPTDLNQLVAEVQSELEEQIEDKQATFDIAPLPTLPVVTFQFRQVFANLLGNALKFTRKGQSPHIVVRAERQVGVSILHPAAHSDQTYHHLTVADNGIGFDPKYSQRIFEVFQRLHGRSDYSGTGIGLAICKKNVEGHGGFIIGEGKPGEGAVFHLYLPEQ